MSADYETGEEDGIRSAAARASQAIRLLWVVIATAHEPGRDRRAASSSERCGRPLARRRSVAAAMREQYVAVGA